MRRGEIRWYRFARQDKRRPVLVLTRDSIIASLGEVTVAPVTTTVRGTPSEVPCPRTTACRETAP
ncbi:MAG: type II toxin-antitoxin system PemK/MazF family toxin [Deltaproteobacteria bacterium]|nr:type II toxin-antitoxin system PemK/MazF family toxin [Deltaproteobacteria bacterium]